jgi:beta-lactamase regulating signal transducer with metallopeptidase domain
LLLLGRIGMNRGAGLMGFGVVLAVVGAILEFAVTASAKGFNIHTIGVILLVVGIVSFVVGLALMISGGSRRSSVREEVHTTAGGQERTVDRRDTLAP